MKYPYERIVTACSFLFIFVNVGFASTSFSVYQPYIVALPGVGDTGGSFILMVRTFVSLLMLIVVGRFYRRFDCRVGILIACFSTVCGFFCYSLANGLVLLCVGAVFTGIGYGLGGMVAMTLLVSRWYRDRIGTAVGIATVGSGVASCVVPFVAVRIIQAFSLGAAFRLEALVGFIIAVIVGVFLRNKPSDIGREPYRESLPQDPQRPLHPHRYEQELDPGTVLSGRARGLLLVAMGFLGAISVAGLGYLSILMVSEGFDELFAAALLVLCGVCLTLSKFVTGKTFDALGARRGTQIFSTIVTLGLVLCCLMGLHSSVVAVFAVALSGVGVSLGTVGISVWSLDLSHPAERPRVIRNFQVAYATGGFLFNIFPGLLKDLFGTYIISYAILAVFSVISAAIVIRVYDEYRHARGFLRLSHKA